mgnify:FL=1
MTVYVSDTNANRKQRQLTIMLVTVSLTFYLFTTPAQISFYNQHYSRPDRSIEQMKREFLFGQISVIILQLNNAVGFCFFSLNFVFEKTKVIH